MCFFQRKHERSSLFTLNDDDEEGLTHYGRSIGGMEKFDHIELSENELEDGKKTQCSIFVQLYYYLFLRLLAL